MGKWKILLLSFIFLFAGCGRQETPQQNPLPRIVSRVEISRKAADGESVHNYTDSEKIRAILLYLRLLTPQGKPDIDPDRAQGPYYEITLYYGQAASKIYRQRGNKYLSVDAKPWTMVEPSQGKHIESILEKIPSDNI